MGIPPNWKSPQNRFGLWSPRRLCETSCPQDGIFQRRSPQKAKAKPIHLSAAPSAKGAFPGKKPPWTPKTRSGVKYLARRRRLVSRRSGRPGQPCFLSGQEVLTPSLAGSRPGGRSRFLSGQEVLTPSLAGSRPGSRPHFLRGQEMGERRPPKGIPPLGIPPNWKSPQNRFGLWSPRRLCETSCPQDGIFQRRSPQKAKAKPIHLSAAPSAKGAFPGKKPPWTPKTRSGVKYLARRRRLVSRRSGRPGQPCFLSGQEVLTPSLAGSRPGGRSRFLSGQEVFPPFPRRVPARQPAPFLERPRNGGKKAAQGVPPWESPQTASVWETIFARGLPGILVEAAASKIVPADAAPR